VDKKSHPIRVVASLLLFVLENEKNKILNKKIYNYNKKKNKENGLRRLLEEKSGKKELAFGKELRGVDNSDQLINYKYIDDLILK
jgi:hypothetical protein